MSNTGNSIKDELIRELSAATIAAAAGAYIPLGPIFLRDCFRLVFTNETNGDIYLSTDGVTDMKKMPDLSSRVYDDKSDDMYRKKGTQWYVRFDVVPGVPAGWVGLETEYV